MGDPPPALAEHLQVTVDAIGLFGATQGRQPSLNDIALMVGVPKSTTNSRIMRLQMMGLVERGPLHSAGTLTLTRAGQDQCSAVEWID